MTYHKILLPTDGSENNQVAVEHAIALAKELDADLVVLSVIDKSYLTDLSESIPLPELFPEADEISKKAVDSAVAKAKNEGVRVSGKVIYGHPAAEIIKDSWNYDLIVMGSLGRSGLSHLLMGSVAENVVRFAHSSVLVIRKTQNGEIKKDSENERRNFNDRAS